MKLPRKQLSIFEEQQEEKDLNWDVSTHINLWDRGQGQILQQRKRPIIFIQYLKNTAKKERAISINEIF